MGNRLDDWTGKKAKGFLAMVLPELGGEASQGIQAFARKGFYPQAPQRVPAHCGLSPTP